MLRLITSYSAKLKNVEFADPESEQGLVAGLETEKGR